MDVDVGWYVTGVVWYGVVGSGWLVVSNDKKCPIWVSIINCNGVVIHNGNRAIV